MASLWHIIDDVCPFESYLNDLQRHNSNNCLSFLLDSWIFWEILYRRVFQFHDFYVQSVLMDLLKDYSKWYFLLLKKGGIIFPLHRGKWWNRTSVILLEREKLQLFELCHQRFFFKRVILFTVINMMMLPEKQSSLYTSC